MTDIKQVEEIPECVPIKQDRIKELFAYQDEDEEEKTVQELKNVIKQQAQIYYDGLCNDVSIRWYAFQF